MFRLELLRDFIEEGWASMELVSEMLSRTLREEFADEVSVSVCQPAFKARFGRLVPSRRTALSRLAFNADRLLNRHVDYPRHLRRRGRLLQDAVHVCDHSYAQLILSVASRCTGVYCHDVDAFRCLIEPDRDRRPAWFRAMARRTLRGMQAASVVFHSTGAVKEELLRHGLVDPDRLVWAPYGPAPEFSAVRSGTARQIEGPYVLHVGSLIPRKRIDLLLEAFGAMAATFPELSLVQVGPPWTAEHRTTLARLGVAHRVKKLTGISREHLAALYHSAELVILPSDSEGFGLPVLEALACGAPVIASDLPAVTEVGGDAVTYLPPGDLARWVDGLRQALADPGRLPDRSARLARAAAFSWTRHAAVIVEAYRRALTR